MMTAYGSVSQAVEAVKRGAYDYIQKPFDLDALDLLIRRCMEQLNTRRSLGLAGAPHHELIGESTAVSRIRGLIGVIAKNDSVDLLIRGEIRYRQGGRGEPRPPAERALRPADGEDQLRGNPRKPAGIRAFRL